VRPGLFNANISLNGESNAALQHEPPLEPPYKASSLPLIDRLAARDRAYGLLAGLTKLGSAWNYSDAWFALARAHEESGQPDKAKEVLGVRQWSSVSGAGGYVL
jgi:cargo-transport protein YPP1